MFDLKFFGNPYKQKKSFLKTQEVKILKVNSEIAEELENLKNNHISDSGPGKRNGSFLFQFFRTFSGLIVKNALLNIIVSCSILTSILLSEQIIKQGNSLNFCVLSILIFTLLKLNAISMGALSKKNAYEIETALHVFLNLRIINKLLRIGDEESSKISSGNLKVLVTSDIKQIAWLIHSLLDSGVPGFFNIIIMTPVIYIKTGFPGIIALSVFFILTPLIYLFQNFISKKEEEKKKEEDKLTSLIGEWVVNIRLVRYLGWNTHIRKKIAAILNRYARKMAAQTLLECIIWGLAFVWWLVPLIVMLYIARSFQTDLTIQSVFVSIWIFNYLHDYIKLIPNIVIRFAFAYPSIKRLKKLWNLHDFKENFEDDYAGEGIHKLKPEKLIFENVSFRYPGSESDRGQEILENINCIIDLNQTTCIIGKVGSGKTTFLKLVCGELKPTDGNVYIEFENGIKVNLWCENIYNHMRSFVGYVPQETYISNTTLENNISLDETPREINIMNSVYLAELESDLKQLKMDRKEELGEHGINLSGGQKQRINLARFYYSKRPYGVLDDPLSSIDQDTEISLFEKLMDENQKFIMSSHRLGRLHLMDRILVIGDGKIQEDGKPGTLLADKNSEFNYFLKILDI